MIPRWTSAHDIKIRFHFSRDRPPTQNTTMHTIDDTMTVRLMNKQCNNDFNDLMCHVHYIKSYWMVTWGQMSIVVLRTDPFHRLSIDAETIFI